jgi:hypothetical protein
MVGHEVISVPPVLDVKEMVKDVLFETRTPAIPPFPIPSLHLWQDADPTTAYLVGVVRGPDNQPRLNVVKIVNIGQKGE